MAIMLTVMTITILTASRVTRMNAKPTATAIHTRTRVPMRLHGFRASRTG